MSGGGSRRHAPTHEVFPRLLDAACASSIERGEGVWLYGVDGREILDACGGGAMVASLGHGRRDIVEAAARQAEELSYMYYHHFTNEPQERLARAGARGRRAGHGPGPLRHRRLGGERDGAPARAPVPRGARRDGALARRLARAGLPRRDRWARSASPAGSASRRRTSPTWPATCTSRRARAASTRPARRRSPRSTACSTRPGRFDRRVLLRARERRRAAGLLAAGPVLGGPRRAARASMASSSASTRSSPASVAPGRGSRPTRSRSSPTSSASGRARRRLRAARRRSCAASTSTRRSTRGSHELRARPHLGRRARSSARSDSPSWTCWSASGSSRTWPRAVRASSKSFRPRSAASTSSARCAAAASCSASSSSTRATAMSLLPAEIDGGALVDEIALEHGLLVNSSPREARTATRATRPCSLRHSPRPTRRSPRWWSASPRRSRRWTLGEGEAPA